ncbi:MAG: PDDEXK nuclease domain-containing protein [Bacteroidales bacterium]|nr:PDDEXK nuclease domain-containing protein [Bacteroidales bacterium]
MNFDSLVHTIHSVQDALQEQAAHAVNLALTARNWLIGYYIVEFEQRGEDRAEYGEQLLKKLEISIKKKGMTERRFREFRRLYIVYPQLGSEIAKYLVSLPIGFRNLLKNSAKEIRQTSAKSQIPAIRRTSAELVVAEDWMLPAEMLFNRISYSNLSLISQIDDPVKRSFYEIENIKGCWSNRELDRQISSSFFERSGLSKNKAALSAMVKQEAVKLTPVDILHEPVTLEFLGFKSKETWTESDLEEAIIDHMQEFLLEMGNGFCFEARQKRILIDSDYFKADLIFYHRILKCHVIVDIKIDRFRHEYASQMNTYLNYYRYEVMQPDDNPPVGLLLCTGKGDTLVKYATAGLDQNIFVQKYMINLPSVEDLTSYIEKETEKEIGRLSSAK